jgi:hypothetical protein
MRHLFWAIPVAFVCIALFAGRDDFRRLRAMARMSRS